MSELPKLPKPELTSWYGPSSELYEEPMFDADQMRSYATEAVRMALELAAWICEDVGALEHGDCASSVTTDSYKAWAMQCAAAIRKEIPSAADGSSAPST